MKDSDLNINEYQNINPNLNIDYLTNEEKDFLIKQNYNFFLEYLKLFQTNEILKSRLQDLITEKNQLKNIINKLEKEKKIKKINDTYTKRKVIKYINYLIRDIEDVEKKLNVNIFVITQIVKRVIVLKVL